MGRGSCTPPRNFNISNDIYIFDDISLCLHLSIKLTVRVSIQSHPELSANYSLSPRLQETTPVPANSKWPICLATSARQGWEGGVGGHMAMPIWGQAGDAPGRPQPRPKAPGFANPVASSTSCSGALWPSINQPEGSCGALQLGSSPSSPTGKGPAS